jgi:hypothetical protein
VYEKVFRSKMYIKLQKFSMNSVRLRYVAIISAIFTSIYFVYRNREYIIDLVDELTSSSDRYDVIQKLYRIDVAIESVNTLFVSIRTSAQDQSTASQNKIKLGK